MQEVSSLNCFENTQLEVKQREMNEDSSDDDASIFLNSVINNSFENKSFEKGKNERRIREFEKWIKQMKRGIICKMVMVSGKNSTEFAKELLEESELIPVLDDASKLNYRSWKGWTDDSIVILQGCSLEKVVSKLDWLEKIKKRQIVFCCNEIKRSPSNIGLRITNLLTKINLQ